MLSLKIFFKDVLIYVILAVIALGGIGYINHLHEENNRLEGNQTALLTDIKTFKTKQNHSAATITALELKTSEFKLINDSLLEAIAELKIKPRNITSATRATGEFFGQFKGILRDSIVVTRLLKTDTLKCFNFKDAYIDISTCKLNDSIFNKIRAKVDLDIIAYQIPKKLLFFKIGVKRTDVTAISQNPYIQIQSLNYVVKHK